MRRFRAAIMVSATVAALTPIGVLASGPGWAIQPTPNLIGATGSDLYGVSCTSVTACTAVGVFDGALPYVERWNGTSWVIQATPNPSGAMGSDLFGVSCASAAACTAIGYYTSDGATYLSLAEGWNGSNWQTQATPNPSGATFSVFNGVSCTSATACTAVGSYNKSSGGYLTLAARWNGSSWAIQATPNPSGAQGSILKGVSCTSATACTAAGYYTNGVGTTVTLVERWNGASWAIQATPTPSGAAASVFSGVSCASATACIAAGYYISGGVLTLAERWNGSTWEIQATPNPSGAKGSRFNGVSCASAPTCTAVGYYTNSGGTPLTLAMAWNGWVIQGSPNPSRATTSILRGVSCTTATACTAVGYSGGAGATLAERWNGKRWAIQATPNPVGAMGNSLYGVSCTTATACTAVGTSVNGSGALLTLAEHWNGSSWAIQATPNPSGATLSILNAVSCASATACTAAGYYRSSGGTNFTLVEHWNGSSWAIQATPAAGGATGSFLEGVSCPSATVCTATGTYIDSGGTNVTLAERWNGSSWSIQATPTPSGATGSYLQGVSCPSPTVCTATGSYIDSGGTNVTLAESWNGSSWAIQPTTNPSGATGSFLQGVSCASATACTAAGYSTDSGGTNLTLVESWDGTSWATQPTPNPLAGPSSLSSVLWGVSCASATACTAVGTYTNSGGINLTLVES